MGINEAAVFQVTIILALFGQIDRSFVSTRRKGADAISRQGAVSSQTLFLFLGGLCGPLAMGQATQFQPFWRDSNICLEFPDTPWDWYMPPH